MTYRSILDLIGNTPLVELQRVNPNPNVKVFAKLEGNNPGGSVKDRAAYSMIKNAWDDGQIDKDTKLIEATSGNTGIALAMIANIYGIKIELVMPETATRERVLTMKAYGATVTLTPKEISMEGARDYALAKVENEGYVMLNQFGNPNNPKAHFLTTGPEIWRDTNKEVSHFVSCMGTTGTIMGTSAYLKEQNENIQIIGAQPEEGSRIPGIRRWPKEYMPTIFDEARVDRVVNVSQQQATEMTRRLAAEEGIFAGMSSGGSAHIACQIASELESGIVVCIICDRGDRYLSSQLFDI